MGGFTLFDGQRPMGVLSHKHLSHLLREGKVRFPDISVKEIEDRSKSDGLAKFLVIGQTTWFILQVITRKVQGLGTTKLEISSLAFAAINATVYFFWWNKPYDVRTSVPVYLLKPTDEPGKEDPMSEYLTIQINETVITKEKSHQGKFSDTEDMARVRQPVFSRNVLRKLVSWPIAALMYVSKCLHNMSENFPEFHHFQHRKGPEAEGIKKVPKFYAILGDYDMHVNLVVSIIGVVFGSIHCAAWSFRFPSSVELILWRVASLLITCIPASFLVVVFSVDGVLKAPTDPYKRGWKGFIRVHISPFMFAVLLPMYGLARAILITESLITLRDLPSSAFSIVSWTTFIPHI
ncbi:hypothetical protein JR316_0007635 [Psilocybe cubensis]|nr:hypothetical protein JR316_0007635 [Psilocybe cubensis]KAH9479058.1 hypothetical protein JR316_0007635 [Psilocybe cubensis]